MILSEFIKANKEAIDLVIQRSDPVKEISDEERRLWVLNDEQLYLWAKEEHVTTDDGVEI